MFGSLGISKMAPKLNRKERTIDSEQNSQGVLCNTLSERQGGLQAWATVQCLQLLTVHTRERVQMFNCITCDRV